MRKNILVFSLLALFYASAAEPSEQRDQFGTVTQMLAQTCNSLRLNWRWVATDGVSSIDCATGSSTRRAYCYCDGSHWQPERLPYYSRLTSDFTTSNGTTALQTITGLTITLPANSTAAVPFECQIAYSQTTVTNDSFGIQAQDVAPTRIDAGALAGTSTTASTYGALANLTSTTATNIVSFVPTVTTTNYISAAGLVQLASNASTNRINFMVSQTPAADVIVVKAGSWCRVW